MKESFEPTLSELSTAIAWLVDRGVSAKRLAAILRTTSVHIRVLVYRGRRERKTWDRALTIPFRLDADPTAAQREALGLRAFPEEVLHTKKRADAMGWLESEISARVSHFARNYRFLDGASSLKQLLPYVGFPSDSRVIGIRGEIHKRTAWFLVHAGLTESALHEAREAMKISAIAYHDARRSQSSRVYVQQVIDSALIASQALLISHRPHTSLQYLDIAKEASEEIGIAIGSDQYRQRGDSLLQQNLDGQARALYERSARAMEEIGEAVNESHVLLYGTRQSNLLVPVNWERAQEILTPIDRAFGHESHEYLISAHWAVACGLATDSPSANRHAIEILEGIRLRARRAGHQATISKLLALTPQLGLAPRMQAAWVRWALYENAFRRK